MSELINRDGRPLARDERRLRERILRKHDLFHLVGKYPHLCTFNEEMMIRDVAKNELTRRRVEAERHNRPTTHQSHA